MSLKANGALKALCLISQAQGQRQRHVHTHAQTCRKQPLLCNQKPRVAVGTRKERAGRERERLDRARTSIKSIRKLQAAASACPPLPVPPENTSSHRDTHLTGGHGGSCQVNTNLFLLPHTREDVANVRSSGQIWTLQKSSSNNWRKIKGT